MRREGWLVWVCALGMGIAGCDSGNKTSNTNLIVTRVQAAGAKCATEGVVVETGADANGNGVLDDAEVTQSTPICSGSSTPGTPGRAGHDTLVNTTTLAVGDLNCAGGGAKIEIGLDDGNAGGIADDKILQAGEVSSTKYVCNGQSADPFYPGATVQPTTPPGTNKIDTSGGNSSNGGGGLGGYVYLYTEYGTLGGHNKIFSTGVVDASFTLPNPSFSAGATPFVVAANTVLHTYADQAAGITSTDAFFQVNGNGTLYKNVTGVATAVTSIDIGAGYTLTFARNSGNDAIVNLDRDLRNAGTIKVELLADAKSSGGLTLNITSYIGKEGSSIALDGLAAAGATGGNAGALSLSFEGSFVNQGALHAVGGDGDAGGAGAEINIASNTGGLWNTGAIDTHGGTGAVTTGGSGGYVSLYSGYRTLYNAGAITSSGGGGVTSGGGAGGGQFGNNNVGGIVNAGVLTHTGGTCSATNCVGGTGGDLDWDAYGGDALNSGAIDTRGADGKGTGNGGNGGNVYAQIYDYNSNYAGEDQAAGSIRFSGNITTKGGNGANGGSGGYVYGYLYARSAPQGQEVAFVGYSDLILNGGSAAGALNTGGDAGYVYFQHSSYADIAGNSRQHGPAGAEINYAAVTARGGDGPQGGRGGYVQMYNQTSGNFDNPYEFTTNYGALDLRGGASTADAASGGDGGYLEMYGNARAANSGVITATAGNAAGANASGGSGNSTYLYAYHGPVSNTAAINISAGTALGAGGNGGSAGYLYMYGNGVSNTAALTANGGNATAAGGDGGYFELFSSSSTATSNTGAMSLSGGTGTPAGTAGTILIDGTNVSP